MFSMTETLDGGFDALVSRNERLVNCAVLSGLESRRLQLFVLDGGGIGND